MLLRPFVLATMGIASLALGLAPGAAGAAGATRSASPLPSCASLQAAHRLSPAGDSVVPASATIPRPMRIRCLGVGTRFLVYIVLANTAGGANSSSYAAGGAS